MACQPMARYLLLLACSCLSASALHQDANPITKVVTMLQNMQKNVEHEGENELKLYDKYMCACQRGGESLKKSIADDSTKVSTLSTDIDATVAQKKTVNEELKQARDDRETCKTAIADATSLREKDAKAYAKTAATAKSDLTSLAGAIKSIGKGMTGSFLQTRGARVLRHIVKVRTDMDESDRETLVAFLSGTAREGEDYAPASGEILGILKQMHDEMTKDFADATAAEKAGIASFEGSMAAKKREVNAGTKAIENKIEKNGELAVKLAQMNNDLGDTKESLEANTKMLADSDKNCKIKQEEWAVTSKTRSDELLAIADTINVLNSDESRDMFHTTLPKAGASSFMQLSSHASYKALSARALKFISKARETSKEPGLDFISLCMRGNKVGFEKVIRMIDDMTVGLNQEQLDDDKKKGWCVEQFDILDDKKKALENKLADIETSMAEKKDAIDTLVAEIAALKDSNNKMDQQVVEAGTQRKAEHVAYTSLIAQNSAAKDVLKFAINRLNQFYNPKLARKMKNPQAGAMVQTGVAQTSSDPSAGIIEMINQLVRDLVNEMTLASANEENSQKDYQRLMQDTADKKKKNLKSLTDKDGAKAAQEAELQQNKDDKASGSKSLATVKQSIAALHADCDWLIQYYDVRKSARASEIDAMAKAKAVLSGADYSLLQVSSSRSLLRGHK